MATTTRANTPSKLLLLLLVLVVLLVVAGRVVEGSWCVAKSNINQTQLQTALDYACGTGADCAPIQSSGLCFLPNTLQSHASYAFNSYYQRRSNAPGSCDFSGSATIAVTDPTYGSCVYPPSPSNAGGGPSPTTPVTPTTPSPPGTIIDPNAPPTVPPPPGFGGLITPGLGPSTFGSDPSESPPLVLNSASMIFSCLIISHLLLVF